MKIPFKTDIDKDNESIMIVGDINPDEIRFNRITKEIYLTCYDTYTHEDLDGMSWQSIKKLVVKNGGSWTSKDSGIKFMIGKEK